MDQEANSNKSSEHEDRKDPHAPNTKLHRIRLTGKLRLSSEKASDIIESEVKAELRGD